MEIPPNKSTTAKPSPPKSSTEKPSPPKDPPPPPPKSSTEKTSPPKDPPPPYRSIPKPPPRTSPEKINTVTSLPPKDCPSKVSPKYQVKKHGVKSFEDLQKLLTTLDNKGPVYIMFTGALDTQGVSWCPDCQKAEPVIQGFLEKVKLKEDIDFIHVEIERSLWKDMNNPFRTDTAFGLTNVPTLVKWKCPQKLTESECADAGMLEILFEDSADS